MEWLWPASRRGRFQECFMFRSQLLSFGFRSFRSAMTLRTMFAQGGRRLRAPQLIAGSSDSERRIASPLLPCFSENGVKMFQLGPCATVSTLQACTRGDRFRSHVFTRLAWVMARCHFRQQQWSRIAFTDESRFRLFPTDGRVRV